MVPTEVTTAPGASVLELDPDLGRDIPREEWEQARATCRGRLVHVKRGRWELPPTAEVRDAAGLVVVRGMLSREAILGGHHMLELLAPGDVLLRPVEVSDSRLSGRIELTAVNEAELVALGESFIRAAARWPTLLKAVQRRLEAQREDLAIQGLIAHFSGADDRLLLMLWHLIERWGIVTLEGIVIPIPLTHELLGQLIRARRPTTTLALGSLVDEGSVRRLDNGSWLLTSTAKRRVGALARTEQAARTLGDQLMLFQLTSQTRAEFRAVQAQARQARRQHSGHDDGRTSA
jgi:CRP/FNR family transcriptional regulator, cyclic AMP receptor protein